MGNRQAPVVEMLVTVSAVLLAAVFYLLYQIWLAEDMIKELNRDYEEVVREKRALEEKM